MIAMFILAQTAWNQTAPDSQNLQDLHDWFFGMTDAGGLAIGLGAGLVFGGGFLVFRYLRRVFNDVDND